jgi:hypothetical protein
MKFSPLVFLAIWMLLTVGCERRQQDSRTSEDGLSQTNDQKDIPTEGEIKSIKKQMGDDTYVHLAWFYDREIAGQLLLKLEEDGVRAVSEIGLGVFSVWVIESREADGLRVLQSNPDWMAARKGVTGDQAKPQQTSAEDGTGQFATSPESKPQGSDKLQPEAEGRSR